MSTTPGIDEYRNVLANRKRVVASWSGGIDSTAVIAHLLHAGYEVDACSLAFYQGRMVERERRARSQLTPILRGLPGGGRLRVHDFGANWIWEFSSDRKAIPRRNKHIMDWLMCRMCVPLDVYNLAMGEYVGADTWTVRDHVGWKDADARALEAYLLMEYGLCYRLITLRDFGESRFKSDRLKLGVQLLGDAMSLTTVCMAETEVACGRCYKCVERSAAFQVIGMRDGTMYLTDPVQHPKRGVYLDQMAGLPVTGSMHDFPMEGGNL